jgi:hypothetical protein
MSFFIFISEVCYKDVESLLDIPFQLNHTANHYTHYSQVCANF